MLGPVFRMVVAKLTPVCEALERNPYGERLITKKISVYFHQAGTKLGWTSAGPPTETETAGSERTGTPIKRQHSNGESARQIEAGELTRSLGMDGISPIRRPPSASASLPSPSTSSTPKHPRYSYSQPYTSPVRVETRNFELSQKFRGRGNYIVFFFV